MSSKTLTPPDLKRLLDKRLALSLNGKRKVVGVLRGFDQFLNVVLEEALEVDAQNKTHDLGSIVIRGNSIVTMEALEAVKSQQ